MNVRVTLVSFLLLLIALPVGAAKKPEDHFRGKIITATKPFPTRFKNDAEFIKYMKQANTKGFAFDDSGKINVEFMAFFAQPYAVTEFTCSIYNVTEGRRLVDSFAIYPQQKATRILASFTSLSKERYEEEARYLMVITPGFRGAVIAETEFAIKKKD